MIPRLTASASPSILPPTACAPASYAASSVGTKHPSPSQRDTGESEVLGEEREKRIRKAVLKLPEKYRRVVVLARFAEMNHHDIGAVLGIPPGTVASRMNKAMSLLRGQLADLNPLAGP